VTGSTWLPYTDVRKDYYSSSGTSFYKPRAAVFSTKSIYRFAFWFSLSHFDTPTLEVAMHDNVYFAEKEFVSGRYRYAVKYCEYALAREPDDVSAWLLLAKSLIQLNDIIGGVDAFENAALLSPLSRQSQIELAIAYGQLGRKLLSRDLLMIVATSDAVGASELLQIATGLEAIDEPKLAMEACRQAGLLAPENAEVHYQMSYCAALCGYPTSVTEALIRQAIDLEPQNIHYRIGLASLLTRLGRKHEAITVVGNLIPGKLDEITCLCCLKRFANLFFDCDDFGRAKACAMRLNDLGSSTKHDISLTADNS
jgi:tetratricopeptide (TPR) repeat protein